MASIEPVEQLPVPAEDTTVASPPTMTPVMWLLLLSFVFLVVVVLNARVRKQVLIATTYISLTAWYYYRMWEKRGGTPPPSSSVKRKSRGATDSDSDVRFFEPAEKVLEAERQREERLSQHSVSENSYRLSETSSSGQSEEPTGKTKTPKSHTGIFRKLRGKDDREVKSESSRLSELSTSSSTTSTRRTFTGRKKPPTWGE